MNLLKLHRVVIAMASVLSALFFVHYFFGLLSGEGRLLVLLGIGVVTAGLGRYFWYLREQGLPGLPSAPSVQSDSGTEAPPQD